MSSGRHLWEITASGGGFCPFGESALVRFESFEDLAENVAEFDDNLNVVIAWHWREGDDLLGGDELHLDVAQPLRERVVTWWCPVGRDQESEVRTFLRGRLFRLRQRWGIEEVR